LAILILVVMLLPIVTSIARDSLNQVPKKLRNASYGIGSIKSLKSLEMHLMELELVGGKLFFQ